MANSFYNYTAPVVAGTTIRADKYNSDQQSIDSAFESTELELDKRLRLPDTFTGNAVIPEVTAADSFLYIDGNQSITLYPAATFQAQFDSVESKFNQINTWQGEVEANKNTVIGHVGTTTNNATTATTQAGLAADARDLAEEWASNPSNVVITGTTEYSAKHWAIKAEEFAAQTLATAEGDFVPSGRTVNSKPLSEDVVLQAADVFAVPTTRTVNSKALSADISLTPADVGALPSNQSFTYQNAEGRWRTPDGATMEGTLGSTNGLQVYQDGVGDAFMTFHANNDFALHFGLDSSTDKLSVGGWTMGANSYAIYHEGNKPTLADIGASDQITYNNAATQVFTRQAVNTYINNWDVGSATYTLDESTFLVGDKVYITKFYDSGSVITITTDEGNIVLPDGTGSPTQTLSVVGTVCLEKIDTTNWIIRAA